MKNSVLSLAIAGSIASALASLAVPTVAAAADKEKCYGIALKGQNDCAAGKHDCAGHSAMDFDGQSFKLVPAGTCMDMNVDGHKGSLTPA